MELVPKKLNEIIEELENIELRVLQLHLKLTDLKVTFDQLGLTINFSSLEERDFMELELEEDHLVILVQCVLLLNIELNLLQPLLHPQMDTMVFHIQMININILLCLDLLLEQLQVYLVEQQHVQLENIVHLQVLQQ